MLYGKCIFEKQKGVFAYIARFRKKSDIDAREYSDEFVSLEIFSKQMRNRRFDKRMNFNHERPIAFVCCSESLKETGFDLEFFSRSGTKPARLCRFMLIHLLGLSPSVLSNTRA